MTPTKRFFTFATVTTLATLTLVLTGMRCTKTTTPEPAPRTTIPVYTQKRIVDRVDWPASSTINQTALKAMKPEEAMKIVSSGVPVLVPSDPKLLSAGIMVEPNEFGYDFALPESIDGIGFTMSSNHVHTESSAPVPAHLSDPRRPQNDYVMVGNRKVVFSRVAGDGEGGVADNLSAGWRENGEATYSVDIVCSAPNDPRCANDTYLKSFIASLVYVGGSGQ